MIQDINPVFKFVLTGGVLLFLAQGCGPPQDSTAPTTHRVEIAQMQFEPEEITVSPGDTVVWINRDPVNHNIIDERAGTFSSDTLKAGDEWSIRVPGPGNGDIEYVCSLHPIMKGRIEIAVQHE